MPDLFTSYEIENNDTWDIVKRKARQRIKYRKFLHHLGYNYHLSFGFTIDELIQKLTKI